MGFGQSGGRSTYEQAYMCGSLRAGGPQRYEHSPKVCRDAFPLQYSSNLGTGSLCSRQPFEQFGVADKPDVGAAIMELCRVHLLKRVHLRLTWKLSCLSLSEVVL